MRLRGVLGLGARAVLAGFALSARRSDAALRICPTGEVEVMVLTPTGAVTDNGLILSREPDSGRYVMDGGRAFDVEAARYTARDAGVTACMDPAKTLALTVVDPFGDGGAVTLEVSR